MGPHALENPLSDQKFLWEGTVSRHVYALKFLSGIWSMLVEGLTHPWGWGAGAAAGVGVG